MNTEVDVFELITVHLQLGGVGPMPSIVIKTFDGFELREFFLKFEAQRDEKCLFYEKICQKVIELRGLFDNEEASRSFVCSNCPIYKKMVDRNEIIKAMGRVEQPNFSFMREVFPLINLAA